MFNKYYLIAICVGLCTNSPLYSMELAEVVVDTAEKSPITINTRNELRIYAQSKNGKMPNAEELSRIHIESKLMTDLMTSLALVRDERTPMHLTMTKSIDHLRKTNMSQMQRHTAIIINKAIQHDGDLTAGSITARKKEIAQSARSPRTKEKSPLAKKKSRESITKEPANTDFMDIEEKELSRKISKDIPELNLDNLRPTSTSSKRSMHSEDAYNKEEDENYINYKQAKKEMRELILMAAENAIDDKDKEARRNLYLAIFGLLTTVASSVAGPIVTYYLTPGNNSTGT